MPSHPSKPRPSASDTHDQKLSALHTYLLTSISPHTLKDLEKSPPCTVPKIRGAEIKELLSALVAEDQVRCEKIGAGNWYWAFASDAVKARETAVVGARNETGRLEESVGRLEGAVGRRRGELYGNGVAVGDAEGSGNADGDGDNERGQREELEEQRRALLLEVKELTAEIQRQTKVGSVGDLLAKKNEVPNLMAKAERWEDNMAILEAYVVKLSGGDRSVLKDVRRAVYGERLGEGDDEPQAKRVKVSEVD